MRDRKIALLAWAFCGLALASALFGLWIEFINRDSYASLIAFISQAAWHLPAIAFAFPAALIVSRQPRNTIGWLLMIPAAASVISAPGEHLLTSIAAADPTPAPLVLLVVFFYDLLWLPLVIPTLLILLLFPSGKPPSGVHSRPGGHHRAERADFPQSPGRDSF